MDESRKAFEKWFNPRKIAMQKKGIAAFRIVRLHKKMLEAWQASRASIDIELPEVCAWSMCELLDKKEVIEAIRAAGIKVKE